MGAIRPGSGGGTSSVAAEDITDATATGRALVTAADAAAARTAIDAAEDGAAPTTSSDAMGGDGWTIDAATGGASATWATSPARLLLECAPGSAGRCSVSHATKLPSGRDYSVAIRLRVLRGDNSNQTRIALVCGRSANDCVVMMFFTDGSIEIGVVTGGVYTYWYVASTIAAINNALRTGGEFWMNFDRRAGVLTWSWGANDGTSGALPTAWNTVYSSIARQVAGQAAQAYAGFKASNGRFLRLSAETLGALDLGVRVDAVVTGLPSAFESA